MSTNPNLKEFDNQIGILSLVRGKENGQNYWAYISFYPSKLEEYEQKISAGEEINMLDFGIVVESGFDDIPSPTIRAYMEEKYQFDHSDLEQ